MPPMRSFSCVCWFIQGILACSETDAHQFIDHLATGEMLEKLDIDNTYFVVKDAVEGFIVILKLNQSIYELTIDENLDLADTFKVKI